MAKQFSPAERDVARRMAGSRKAPVDIWKKLKEMRAKRRLPAPDLTSVRRLLKCVTHRADAPESRGRKAKLGRAVVLRMNKVRKQIIKKADGQCEIHWEDIRKKSRVPAVHPTTVARSFAREEIGVQWRAPRTRPLRGPEHEAERKEACRLWSKKPRHYFTDTIDFIMDNTVWDVPATDRARKYLNACKVRGHMRTRAEGLSSEYTKPCAKKHHMNTGGKLKVVAGISNCRVALWHYIEGPWNGAAAATVYQGPVLKALKRHRDEKGKYVVLEDNDPVGYKSNKTCATKAENNIHALHFPRYSPDLNPMDYFLWAEVERRMVKGAPKKLETIDAFKARLRHTALAIPTSVVRKGVASMNERARDCFANAGKFVTRD